MNLLPEHIKLNALSQITKVISNPNWINFKKVEASWSMFSPSSEVGKYFDSQ